MKDVALATYKILWTWDYILCTCKRKEKKRDRPHQLAYNGYCMTPSLARQPFQYASEQA